MKKLIALFLALIMVLSLIPAVSAAEEAKTISVSEKTDIAPYPAEYDLIEIGSHAQWNEWVNVASTNSKILKQADGLATDPILSEDIVDMLTHRVHLVSQVRQFAELVKHVVQLIGCVDGRGCYLAGVDDHRLGPGQGGEAQQRDEC